MQIENIYNELEDINLKVKQRNIKTLNFEKKYLLEARDFIGNKRGDVLIKNFVSEDLDYKIFSDTIHFLQDAESFLTKIKNKIDLEKFYGLGHKFDFKKLKETVDTLKFKKRFPNFNWKKFKEYCENPPLEFNNFENEKIIYDPFIVNKYIIMLIQMIFSEMDLYIVTCGKEGSGKSCFTSQQMLWFYNVLTHWDLINYEYNVKEMFYSNVEDLMNDWEKLKNDDYFRIKTLDEGDDLNRNNYRSEQSIMFKSIMRRARKTLGILFINLPAIGELDTSITMSRANFIFDLHMDSDVTTGTLKKGLVDMYILPRGDEIYSEKHRNNFNGNLIRNRINEKLQKKSEYYTGLPKDLIIKSFNFDNVWGFDKSIYDEHIKDQNKMRLLSKEQKVSDKIAYILYKKCPDMKEWDFDVTIPAEKRMYDNVRSWLHRLGLRFKINGELADKISKTYSE